VKILFWEEEARQMPLPEKQLSVTGDSLKVAIMLGPEGGLTEDEVATAREAGFSIHSLGPRILKAETAAVAACTLIQYVYGDMGKGDCM
jgi:16S rRNA (uracil1498-N3)-methyltransferase